MAEPGCPGAAPSAPRTGLDWRHLACAAHANDLPTVTRMLASRTAIHPQDGSGVSALHWACFNGNQQMAAQLLAAGANVNATLSSGRTPLHLAVLGKHSSTVDLLLASGADVTRSSTPDGPPLAVAVNSGHAGLVSKLLEAGANPNATGATTPASLLLLAITKGYSQITERLLQAGASAGADVVDGATKRTALHLAAEQGDSFVVGLLVALEVPVDARDTHGGTPLLAAVAAGHGDVVAQLIAAGADGSIGKYTRDAPIHAAAAKGDAELVRMLLDAGASARNMDNAMSTSLDIAAAAGHTSVVDVLLAAPGGVGPNEEVSTNRRAAMHVAARAGRHEVLQRLIAAGGNVNLVASNADLDTPLGNAVRSGSSRTLGVLLAAGADPNAAQKWGTPLRRAVKLEVHDDIIRQLVQGGADINATDAKGQTVLLQAVKRRQYAMVELLLQLGARLDIATNAQGTPLHLAVEMGDAFLAQQLAAPGTHLNTMCSISSSGGPAPCTPLYLAVLKGQAGMVEVLLAAGADASQGINSGCTPLHAALQAGQRQLVDLLLAAGADVNAVFEEAGTTLALTINAGDDGLIDQLLALGADPTLSSSQVAAPLMAAITGGNQHLLGRLLAAPALKAAKLTPVAAANGGGIEPSQAPAAAAAAAAAPAAGAAGPGASGWPGSAAVAGSGDGAVVVRASWLTLVQQQAAGGAATNGFKITGQPISSSAAPGPGSCSNTWSTSSSIRDRIAPMLLAAVRAKDVALVAALLKVGAPPDCMDAQQAAPLQLAIEAADAALVEVLLEGGADANIYSAVHGTPLGAAVNARNSKFVKMLLEAGALPDPPSSSSQGVTPLHSAVGLGSTDIAGQLLAAGADANSQSVFGCFPLRLAASNGDLQMVALLLKAGATVSTGTHQGNALQAAVHAAVQSYAGPNNGKVVQALLEAGADPNAPCLSSRTGASLLHTASASGKAQLVRLLVSAGAVLDASCGDGTPLQLAVAANAEEVVRVLLEAGASPGACALGMGSSLRAPPLELALDRGYPGIAQALLAHGADPNASHSSGCGTLLHAAVASSSPAIVAQLLAGRANPNIPSSLDGRWPLLMAVRQGAEGLAWQLLAAGAWPNVVCSVTHTTPLQAALRRGLTDLALRLLAAGADPNLGSETSVGTPLQLAIPLGWPLVKGLLAAGAPPDGVSKAIPATPLQLAVRQQRCQEAALLLTKGANASVVDSSTLDTLLHIAVRSGNRHLVALLLPPSADVNTYNAAGDTPLLIAMQSGQAWEAGIVQQLLENPWLDCNARDNGWSSALHYAASDGNSAAVELLLGRGADPAAINCQGRMPLHLAAAEGHLAAVQQLVAAGADVDAPVGGDGWTPLLLAAAGAYGEVVRWLLDHGAADSVSAADAGGTTALHLACSRPGTEAMVQALLAAGAAPAAADSSGTMPLHLAAAAGSKEVVVRLMAAGAPACVLNTAGELPLHLAISKGHTQVALLLTREAARYGGKYVNAPTAAGSAPIHLAAAAWDGAMLTELLTCKELDIDMADGAGQTAMLKAAASSRCANVQNLLQSKASLNVKDASGATPLHLAAASAFAYGCVRPLVEAGADRDALDGSGATPLHRVPPASLVEVPPLLTLLATPSNIDRVVKGTTLLHTAAAGDQQGLVSALLAAGASPSALDGSGESALTQAARRGSTAMLALLLRHQLWQHKRQQHGVEAVGLPPEVALAMQEAVACSTAQACCVWTAVMDVLGEDAASALWQQVTQRPGSSLVEPEHQQQGSQQQQQEGSQHHQQQAAHQGAGRGKQPQLKRAVLEALLQGWREACTTWVDQRKSSLQPLAEALKDTSSSSSQQAAVCTSSSTCAAQLATSSQEAAGPAGSSAGAPQPAAVGAGAASGSTAGPSNAQHAAKGKSPTIGQLVAAAGLGQQQHVLELLQRLPAGVQASALVASAKAAAAAGHYSLCVQLAQQLATLDQPRALLLVQEVVGQCEGCGYDQVEVLGPSSLALCEALLGGWQAVRRQQQQELVDGVVSAAVAWRQAQQEGGTAPHGAAAKRQRVGAPKPTCQLRRRRPPRLAVPAAGGLGTGVQPVADGAAAQQLVRRHNL